MSVQKQVQDRYAQGAKAVEPTLCCPVNYNPEYLKVIPSEVLQRDYGCGDPSRYVREGETVLDLGSGGGKICFIASQIVGEKGKVIGVDMTPEMLQLAKNSAPLVAEKIGYANVEFKKGYIQNLKRDLEKVENFLEKNPVKNIEDLKKLENFSAEIEKNPLIPSDSIDVIVSNCVLNLVSDTEKKQLFSEMFRVLKKGGRIAISDIVSDEISPDHLKNDTKLWSGCISGALQESEFCTMLEEAGFYGITLDKFEEKPWQIVEGIEYRSVTVVAYKGKQGECLDKNQAVIYKGPWNQVMDDDGHILRRGDRMAVCEKTFEIYKKPPYSEQIIPIDSAVAVQEKINFSCEKNFIRTPEETKSGVSKITTNPDQCDGGSSGCC